MGKQESAETQAEKAKSKESDWPALHNRRLSIFLSFFFFFSRLLEYCRSSHRNREPQARTAREHWKVGGRKGKNEILKGEILTDGSGQLTWRYNLREQSGSKIRIFIVSSLILGSGSRQISSPTPNSPNSKNNFKCIIFANLRSTDLRLT